jgi:cytochrome c biogenesis protein CcdA
MISLVVLTFIMFGGGGFMMGQALADTWRPWWQIIPYSALLALGNNFLGFALFDGAFFVDSLFSKNPKPLSEALLEYLFDFVVIIAFAALAFRLTQARKMAAQYPWLYERTGPFHWREKNTTNSIN